MLRIGLTSSSTSDVTRRGFASRSNGLHDQGCRIGERVLFAYLRTLKQRKWVFLRLGLSAKAIPVGDTKHTSRDEIAEWGWR